MSGTRLARRSRIDASDGTPRREGGAGAGQREESGSLREQGNERWRRQFAAGGLEGRAGLVRREGLVGDWLQLLQRGRTAEADFSLFAARATCRRLASACVQRGRTTGRSGAMQGGIRLQQRALSGERRKVANRFRQLTCGVKAVRTDGSHAGGWFAA